MKQTAEKLTIDEKRTLSECATLPSELMKQRDELLEVLKLVKICTNYTQAKIYGVNNPNHWTNKIDNAIKNCE